MSFKFFLHKNQWEHWVSQLGLEWVEKHCVIIKQLPTEEYIHE